jgi:hypothetical protein
MDLREMFHTSLLVLVPVILGKLLCLQQPSEQAKVMIKLILMSANKQPVL